MTQFDWRTDEDQGWDQSPEGPTPPSDPRPRWQRALQSVRRRWRSVLTGVLILAALIAFGARVVTLRVEQAEATARAEINAAFGLLVDAVANRDDELFLTLLGGDRSWRRAQLDTFEHNAFLRRDALGLTWQAQEESPVEISLSPDLQQALITATLSYEGYAGADVSQIFALQHALHYEREGAQWRLTPRDEDRDAGWAQSSVQERLQAVFPREDAALGRRLAEEMRVMLQTVCDTVAECPDDLQVHVRFDLMPGTLHTPSIAINGTRRNRLSIYMPAPSLVGLPVDETGYAALRNAYLRTMLDRLLTTLVWRDVSPGSAFQNALRRQVLVALDLSAWPPAAVAELPRAAEPDVDILALCAGDEAQRALLLRYDSSDLAWKQELQGRDFRRLTGVQGVPGVLLRELRPPSYDPQPRVVWWGAGRELAVFDDLDLGEVAHTGPAFIAGTSAGQGYWIYLGQATDCNGRDCQGTVVRNEQTAWSPDGQHTLFHRELEGSRSPPAGDHVLWLGDGNGQALLRLDAGFNPFWIDGETFGYLVVALEGERTSPLDYELVVRRLETDGTVSTAAPVPLRIREALQPSTPDGESFEDMGIAISYVVAHASRPQTIYIAAVRFADLLSSVARPQSSIYLFAADVGSGEVSMRIPSGQVQWTILPRLSPDGRLLAYVTYDPQSGDGAIVVHDLSAEVAQATVYERQFYNPSSDPFYGPTSYPSIDWSQNAGDLLILDEGVLHIVDSRTWTEESLVPPTPACSHAAWAD